MGFVRVTEFKTKIDVARCWTCSRSPSGKPGSSSIPVLSEKLVTDNVVSRLKSNRTQGLPGDPLGGAPPSGIPPGVYFVSLTLGGRVVTVKLLAGTRLWDTGQVPLHHRPLAQRGGGLPGRRSRTSKGRQGPGTPRSGVGRGFRATSRSSP